MSHTPRNLITLMQRLATAPSPRSQHASRHCCACGLRHVRLLHLHRCLLSALHQVGQIELSGAVRRAHHRSGRNVQETHALSHLGVCVKRLWRDILRHSHVLLGRPHVLPQRHHVHARVAQRLQCRDDLLARLATPKHNAALGHARTQPLCRRQHAHALLPVGAAVADHTLQPLHRLNVVRVHIQTRIHNDLGARLIAAKVGHQRLHQQPARSAFLEQGDGAANVRCAAIRKIVAVNAGQHHIVEPPRCDCFGHRVGLFGVERRRRATCLDSAESASARARVAHEHDGRGCSVAVAASPALANVGAARLLAHSRQLEFTQL
mmetsp:Transcript_5927/g.18245  ORF Transcript_5927/g.18245 Transcript_5927/m.18245 type:complete len:321 (-) Transcript_5927:427-1389(-)